MCEYWSKNLTGGGGESSAVQRRAGAGVEALDGYSVFSVVKLPPDVGIGVDRIPCSH